MMKKQAIILGIAGAGLIWWFSSRKAKAKEELPFEPPFEPGPYIPGPYEPPFWREPPYMPGPDFPYEPQPYKPGPEFPYIYEPQLIQMI